MNIFSDRTHPAVPDFLIFSQGEDGKAKSGVDFGGGPLMLIHQAGRYRVYHHTGGTQWVSYFTGRAYSAAAYLLVRIDPARVPRENIERATILLEVEPARKWRACKRQMIRACDLLSALERGDDDSK